MDYPELQTKYQKLATEYAKLRVQNQVLKKAVVEEQDKSSRGRESLKLQDQTVRKLEQELDSITFRNEQLLKRLSILQHELDGLQMKGSKKNQNNTAIFPDENVYVEELQRKIEEIAKLHAKLSDMEEECKGRISELEYIQSSLRQEIIKLSEDFKSIEGSLKGQIRDLENEKIISEVSSHQKKNTQLLLTEEKSSIIENFTLLSADSSKLKKELAIEVLNNPSQRKDQLNLKSIVKSFEQPILCLSSGFCSFLRNYSSDMKQISPQLLADEEKTWQNLATTFSNFKLSIEKYERTHFQLEDMVELQQVSKAFTSCAASLRKVLPVLTEKSGYNSKMDAPWRSSLGRFVSCWAAATPHVTSLIAMNEKRNENNSANVSKAVNSLEEKLQKLHSSSLDLISSWQSFSGSCEENGVKKSLQAIINALETISSLFSSKTFSQWSQVCSTPSTPSSVSVCTPINTHPPTLSVMAHDVSGWSGNSIDSSTVPCSDTSLVQQVAMITSRLSKVEEEKEYWKLEYHLLSHKLQTDKQHSANNTASSNGDGDKSETCQQDRTSEGIISHSILAEVTGEMSFEERESQIRSHYNNRCCSLHKQLMWATSQAALFQNECEVVMKRLEINETIGTASEKEIETLRRQLSEIEETLQTTSRNYEEQISTMSEHLADLNDKLTSQQDLIEDMLFQQKRKMKK